MFHLHPFITNLHFQGTLAEELLHSFRRQFGYNSNAVGVLVRSAIGLDCLSIQYLLQLKFRTIQE